MSKQFWKFLAVGLVVMAIVVAGILYLTRGERLELKGAIQKVRIHEMADSSTIAVFDFRFVNPSTHMFVVRTIEVTLEDSSGRQIEGRVSSAVDAQRLFEFYPVLGQRFNDCMKPRDKVGAGQAMDRMVAARFELPESAVAARKNMRIRLEDLDGAVSELAER